jgi:hypothetical protein
MMGTQFTLVNSRGIRNGSQDIIIGHNDSDQWWVGVWPAHRQSGDPLYWMDKETAFNLYQYLKRVLGM